jgi:uncharacterized protein YndB with AHSA1/START domain
MPVSNDWTRFTLRINIDAKADQLYKGWATKAGIEYWFLRMADYRKPDGTPRANNEYVEAGDTYSWRWHGYPDEVTETGRIIECNGKDYFKFSFGKAGDCIVTIKEEQGQTIVELVQENIPDDDQGSMYYHVGCKTGWTFHLADMKSLYEGGIDLRNKDEKLKEMLNS